MYRLYLYLYLLAFLLGGPLLLAQSQLTVNPGIVNVTIGETCNGAPPCSFSQAQVNPASVSVTSTGSNFQFTATSPVNWIQVSPAPPNGTFTTPASLSLSVAASSAVSGVQVVTLTPAPAGARPQVIVVVVNINCTGDNCPVLIPGQGEASELPAPVPTPPNLAFPTSNGALSQTLVLEVPPLPQGTTVSDISGIGVSSVLAGQSSTGSTSPSFIVSPMQTTDTNPLPSGGNLSFVTVSVSPDTLQAGVIYIAQIGFYFTQNTGGPTLATNIAYIAVTYEVPPLSITTSSPLAPGTIGVNYSQSLAATGGTPPYTWSVSSGSLPAGLSLNGSTISGVPQSAGTSSFVLSVTDSVNSPAATQSFTLTIQPAVQLTISSLSPSSATAGGPAFTLTVNGSGFVSGSSVEWNGSPVSTTFIGANQLSAAIPASLIASAVTASVTVVNTGAGSSNAVTFTVNSVVAPLPTITEVVNNYSLIPAGFVNSGIAPGTLFIVKGSLLASATSVSALHSSAPPGLPATLNGATVNVTVNGTTTHPAFYYAEDVQLAVVMPSNTPVGAGTVTVTYNGQTSAPFSIQVVANAFGFASYDGTGSGLGLATNATTYALYTYSNSIPPGTTIVLYGSGLGADTARDTTYTPVAFNINSLAHIHIGGIDAAIFYQGASGYPGLNEIDVTVPADAPTGCNVSVMGVNAAGVPTNSITLPIGTGQCEDPALRTRGSRLTTLSGQETVNTGVVELEYRTSPATGAQTGNLAASFMSRSGRTYAASSGIVSIGGCIVSENLTSSSTGATTTLNAGAVSVSGPSVGTFALQGTAGTQVGAFATQIVFANPALTWTNWASAAAVTRSVGLPITWSGGAADTYVVIRGSSSTGMISGSFTCLAPVSAGQFTVPSYVLAVLPAGKGALRVGNETAPETFTATGLDYGYAAGIVTYEVSAAYE